MLRLYDPADRGHVDYHDFNKRLGKLFSTTKSGEILVAPFSEQKRLGGLPPGPPQTPTLAGRLESTVAMQVSIARPAGEQCPWHLNSRDCPLPGCGRV